MPNDDMVIIAKWVHVDKLSTTWVIFKQRTFLFGGTKLVIFVWTSQCAAVKYILFGLFNESDNQIVLNICNLHVKNYILKQRLYVNNNLVLGEFKRILWSKFKIEKNINQTD